MNLGTFIAPVPIQDRFTWKTAIRMEVMVIKVLNTVYADTNM